METTNRWIVCPISETRTREHSARLEEWRGPQPDAVRSEDVRIIAVPGRFASQRQALTNGDAYCQQLGLTIHETPQELR